MYTVTDILQDTQRGCALYNMVEDKFSYRLVYFINERNGKSTKHYHDSTYGNLRKALENIIRNNLSMTNNIVIAQITVLKNGKCICLLNRSYSFSLDEFFERINGGNKRINNRCAVL
jgi:hypothetical protein